MVPRPYATGLQGEGVPIVTPAEFKAAREELGWTQSALASALGVTLRAVQYYESGQRAISRPVERLLVSVLGVTRATP